MMKKITFLASRHPFGGVPHPIPIDIERHPHILLTGGTGSGKSMAALLITAKFSLHFQNSKIWILDYKGDDTFRFLSSDTENARYYRYTDCLKGLENFFSMFQERLSGNPDRSIRLLYIDELPSMLLNLPKKESEAAKTMIATVLMMGRSMGCFVLTCTQRASAELFPQGSRDNYSIVIALGNISKESAGMLGFDREKFIPVKNIGEGHLLLSGTDQQAIQMPLITSDGLRLMKADILQAVTR